MRRFRSTRLLRASTIISSAFLYSALFRSTRLLRASTQMPSATHPRERISIHEALASLDGRAWHDIPGKRSFRSTRLLRASTGKTLFYHIVCTISIHEALASLDLQPRADQAVKGISIHEALASLDRPPSVKSRSRQKFRSTRLLRASTLCRIM